jgi:hypothetical protein
MKTRLLVLSMFLLGVPASTPFSAITVCRADLGEYQKGWGDGWPDGWRSVKGPNSQPPQTPLPGLPKMGRDSYHDGYEDGFYYGKEAAEKSR